MDIDLLRKLCYLTEEMDYLLHVFGTMVREEKGRGESYVCTHP